MTFVLERRGEDQFDAMRYVYGDVPQRQPTRDGLLYEIRRSLLATHPDRAEALCAALERLMIQPCERCGSDDATYDANPYAAEIHGDRSPCWMCFSCRMASAREV